MGIYPDNVSIMVPYWYEGAEIDKVFAQVSACLRVIGKAAGYFVYDSQKEVAYDPVKTELGGRGVYAEIMRSLPGIMKRVFKDGDVFKPSDEP